MDFYVYVIFNDFFICVLRDGVCLIVMNGIVSFVDGVFS